MRVRSRSRLAVVSLAVLFLALAGCRHGASPQAASVKRYPLHGLVLGKSAQTRQLTIQQRVIPGFMPAMTAVYKVKNPAAIQKVQPGDQISAVVLAPSDSVDFVLDDIAVTSQRRPGLSPTTLPAHSLLTGEAVPDVPLVNQDGKTIHLPDYRGKAVLITFVDAQCKTDCPLITARFQKVNDLLAKDPEAWADSRLIVISLDPAHDTPPMLRKYGLPYLDGNASGFSHWEFADTTPAGLKRLATAFGVSYRTVNDDIVHTMETSLISPSGTLEQTWDGDDWKPSVVAKQVAKAVESAAAPASPSGRGPNLQ